MNHSAQKTAPAANAHWHMGTPTVQLTAKEMEVLQWAALGKSAWEISRIQDRTEAAVNFHMCNIRRKFGVNSLRAALIKAIEQRVILLE
ncbi:LuxR family transcriptional regulator [Pseudomonas syringae]|uniref:LuxR family transcriptional regulator n=2 Tax=Pseudomonas syringae TaxID=317 RepID=A0A1C7Z468_PSESX|nr:helix-turn-helix domain-containing protein [Pseudomonas syringae]OCR23757.1 LuxR family transcriptional regulator [Pseudomonas syringae]